MTQAEWIEHWEARIIGIALTGLIEDGDDRVKGPLTAGRRAIEVPAKIRKLLKSMHSSAQPEPPPPPPASGNGTNPPATSEGASNGTARTGNNNRGKDSSPTRP